MGHDIEKRHLPRRGVALIVVMALMAAACAGSVGRYRDAEPLSGELGVQGAVVDPETGELIDPETGELIDPETGEVIGAPGEATTVGGTSVSGGANDESSTSSTQAPAGIGSTTGVTKDEIRIGLFYSKTGFGAGILRNAPNAVQAAFDEAGRVHGRKLVLRTYDDGTYNTSTIQAEERRAKDEVFAYISVSSESNSVVAPLANQHRVPAIVGLIDDRVARPLRYAFTLIPYHAYQAANILPGFIKKNLKGGEKRIGIVYQDTSMHKAAKESFKSKAGAAGLNVVYEQPVPASPSSCANEVSNLQAHDVELVYMQNNVVPAICMLRDSRSLGYDPIWTGVGASWNVNVVSQAVGGAARGIRTLGAVTTLETRQGKHYSEVMRESGHGDAADDDLMMAFYALAVSLVEGLRRTGPNLGREAFVRTFETKMNGYNSGYLPPPKFAPGDRSGPVGVSVTACCSEREWWYTVQPQWRSRY